MGCFGGGMPPPKHPKHSFCGIAHAPQGICNCPDVVADHVLVKQEWLQECVILLSVLPALFVAVRCPLAVLEAREAARKDRTLGQARAQFDLVHEHGIYDLEVDTSQLSAQACAQQIKERIEEDRSPDAFKRLRQEMAA